MINTHEFNMNTSNMSNEVQDLKTIKKEKDLLSSEKFQNEEYSFNQVEGSNVDNTYQISEGFSRGDLHLKFASIFEELKSFEGGEIVELFLEELD